MRLHTIGPRAILLVMLHAIAFADDSPRAEAPKEPVEAARAAAAGGPAGAHSVSTGAAAPPGTEQPNTADKSADKNKSENAPKVFRRDELEAEPANAAELQKAVLGEDGKVAFEFRGQTWPELIQWLSALTAKPIDWQELPGDRVNITTPGRYTADEVTDLLNRHLLARGYTLVHLEGGLSVFKCDAINPSLVPRVEEAELQDSPPNRFVRVSLNVGWLSAEKLATELKPMMSKNGVLTALTTTNRIEAMDSAITLMHVAALLAEERSAASREALAPEFKLRYLPADEAKLLLEQFLGIEKKKETPLTPEQMAMMQQMRQQQGGPPPVETKKPEISVVANNRQNSIIIMAPPDRIAVATEFIKRIDVPSSTVTSLSDVQNRVQVFRLASLDPAKLIEILQEMNILEPTTRTRIDDENRAVIVSGSAADRFIISQLIERLDGSGRQFEVLQLRRLDATDVAESIAFLMGQEKEEEDGSRNRRYSYFFGMDYGQDEKKKEDKFRVAANARFRQVLLWANEIEMAEVRNLLVKLGELPPPGGDSRTVRMIEASPTVETLEYLQRLKSQWQQIAPNEIELPPQDLFTDPSQSADQSSEDDQPEGPNKALPAEPEEPEEPKKEQPRAGMTSLSDEPAHQFVVVQTDAPKETEGQPNNPLPSIRSAAEFDRAFATPPSKPAARTESTGNEPIRVEIDRNGNLILSSRDTAALDRLEGMMLQFGPPKKPYRVFKIQHASASWMRLNLEDYFKDNDDDKESDADSFFRWYWGGDETEEKKQPAGLGKGNKLRFVDDIDTNTIVATGATPEQLETIAELIELWDVPEPVNKRKTRFTRLVPIQFGRASKIAETVKDAYRDLLSSNDKAFQQPERGGQSSGSNKNSTPRSRYGEGSDLVDTAGSRESGGSDFTFKGKLAFGVDEVGNTLLISAEGEPLLDLVCDMIKQLDEASRPSGDVQVVRLSGAISGQSLEAALRAFTGPKAAETTSPASNRDARNSPPPVTESPEP